MEIEIFGKAADATKEVAITARPAVEAIARAIGPVAEEAGLFAGDAFRAARLWCAERVFRLSEEKLEVRGVDKPEPISLRQGLPLLQAISEESNPTMQDLWSRLIANARDPNRRAEVRPEFLKILGKLTPVDALVLETIWRSEKHQIQFAALESKTHLGSDALVVSATALKELGTIKMDGNPLRLTPLGRELMRACDP